MCRHEIEYGGEAEFEVDSSTIGIFDETSIELHKKEYTERFGDTALIEPDSVKEDRFDMFKAISKKRWNL